MFRLLTIASLACTTVIPVLAAQPQTIRIAQERYDASVHDLPMQIIEHALQQAKTPLNIEWVSAAQQLQPRALGLLEGCHAPFDAYFSGYDKYREANLLQVNVPITLGLLGVRGFVTTPELQDTIKDQPASEWTIGSGLGWPDSTIMVKAGYDVYQAPFDNLWRMLDAHRIHVFQRGVQESQMELAQREGNFVLMEHAIMLYPFGQFLYVSPCYPTLHQQLTDALQRAFESGQTESLIRSDSAVQYTLKLLNDPDIERLVLENAVASDAFVDDVRPYILREIREILWPEQD